MFADNTPIDEGISLQLLSDGVVISAATTNADGVVTFDVDPGTLKNPAINLAPQQSPPTT